MSITTFSFYGSELRDDQSGLAVKHHTQAQRAAYLLRHPDMAGKLPDVRDPNERPALRPTVVNTGGVRFSEPGLLADPAPVRKAPVAATRRHASERAIAVAWHEAFHTAAALYYGLRVSSSTILPDGRSDGCTVIQDVKEIAPTLHGLVMFAGQEGDAIGGFRLSSENYSSDNVEVGGSLEWREALRERLRSDLPQFVGGATEIARQLLAKETLTEFQVKAAYLTGQRRGVAVRRSTSQPTQKVVGTTAKQPQQGRVIREFNMSNPQDARDFAALMGCKAGEEAIGYTGGHVVQGSYKQ